MVNFILTYNIDNAHSRTDFVKSFEDVLVNFKLNKEHNNQSTYFGQYRSKEDLLRDLFNATNKLGWAEKDTVTIYYPKVTKISAVNRPDIGKHLFKMEGSKELNHLHS